METTGKVQMRMPEIKKTVLEMKNAFDGFISTLNTTIQRMYM